jgi:hypothetical protein
MTKKIIVSFLMVLFVSTVAFSQNWKFSKVIYYHPEPNVATGIHGVAVPPDNTIWVGKLGADIISNYPNGTVIVFNSDGSFKRVVSEVTINGVTDPWNGDSPTHSYIGGNRGMSTGPDGHVYCSAYQAILKFDYLTYETLLYIHPAAATVTTAVADQDGNIVNTFVYARENGVTTYIDGGSIMYAVDPGNLNLPGISRDIALSPDGKDLFIASTDASIGVTHWHSENGVWEAYEFVKQIGNYGARGQDVYFDAKGRLWVGFDALENSSFKSRYDCWDLNTMTIVDFIESTYEEIFNTPVPEEYFREGSFGSPRGFALNSDMTKAYIVDYQTGVLEYEYVGPSNVEEPKAIPEGFALSQNYPNPFNPTTNFSYSVPKASDVRIAVYDLFGREIKTLVNESKDAGTYRITWNGRDNNNKQVSTGVYFYKTRANGFEKTMKMMLMK